MQQAELIDSKEKLKELEEAASEGFARAQFNLAMCYEQGKWVEPVSKKPSTGIKSRRSRAT